MPSQKFADKYLLATEQAAKEKPSNGLNGFEQEWNLVDESACMGGCLSVYYANVD